MKSINFDELPTRAEWRKYFKLEQSLNVYKIETGSFNMLHPSFISPGIFQVLNIIKFSFFKTIPLTHEEIFNELSSSPDMCDFISFKQISSVTARKKILDKKLRDPNSGYNFINTLNFAKFNKRYGTDAEDPSGKGRTMLYWLNADGWKAYELYLHLPWMALSLLNTKFQDKTLFETNASLDNLSNWCFAKLLDPHRFKPDNDFFEDIDYQPEIWTEEVLQSDKDFKWLRKFLTPETQIIRELALMYEIFTNQTRSIIKIVEEKITDDDTEELDDPFHKRVAEIEKDMKSLYFWQLQYWKELEENSLIRYSNIIEDRLGNSGYKTTPNKLIRYFYETINFNKYDPLHQCFWIDP